MEKGTIKIKCTQNEENQPPAMKRLYSTTLKHDYKKLYTGEINWQ